MNIKQVIDACEHRKIFTNLVRKIYISRYFRMKDKIFRNVRFSVVGQNIWIITRSCSRNIITAGTIGVNIRKTIISKSLGLQLPEISKVYAGPKAVNRVIKR